MDPLPAHLQRLDEMLLDLRDDTEAMLLSELDGFLAGVVVSPEPILPSEWLRIVWGGVDGELAPFENSADVQAFVGLVMRHYNSVIRSLERRGRFAPIFEVDGRNNETLWELWIAGFARAVRLRPEGWERIVESDEEDAIRAYSGLMLLGRADEGTANLSQAEIDALDEEAEDLIPMWVEALHAWRRIRAVREGLAARAELGTKVGRNDPCPCGSGKKYKKCCGLN